MEELGEAALVYAGRGWLVFPLHSFRDGLCTCRRPDCKNPAKHPRTRRGFRDATTDEKTIREWWRECPDANVGIRT